MKIFRARNEAALEFVEGKLLPDPDYEEGAFLSFLKDSVNEEWVNLSMACDVKDGKGVCVAFVLAIASPGVKSIFVQQAWASSELEGTKIQDALMLRVCMWAEEHGRMTLKCETSRSSEAFLRRWGFKESSRILAFDIEPGIEGRLVEGRHEELKGQKEKSEEKIVGDVETKAKPVEEPQSSSSNEKGKENGLRIKTPDENNVDVDASPDSG